MRPEEPSNKALHVSALPSSSVANFRGSITESRPTNPLFIADSQPPPEEYGRDRYTSRQPWMSQEEAIIDRQGSTSAVVIDGASLSPFAGHAPRAPTRPQGTENPDLVPANGVAIDSAPEAIDEPEKVQEPRPIVRRSAIGRGLIISLFALFSKGVPLILVMGGGYYTYSYFFGPIPIVDQVWRKSAELVGVTPAPIATQSKASQILQQTRDVVKANDQRVHFASALADDEVDLNELSDPAAMDGASPTAETGNEAFFQMVAEKAKSELDRKWNSQLVPDDSRSNGMSANDSLGMQNTGGVVEVATDVLPSPEFFRWVNQATISGVRNGEEARVFINDMAMELGEMVYRPLGITIDELDLNETILIFRDKTGAKLGKQF